MAVTITPAAVTAMKAISEDEVVTGIDAETLETLHRWRMFVTARKTRYGARYYPSRIILPGGSYESDESIAHQTPADAAKAALEAIARKAHNG